MDWERNNNIPSAYNVLLGEEDECKGYWKDAERVLWMFPNLNFNLQKEFKAARKIKISDQSLLLKTCYRPELFANMGWCKLASDKRKWGFCSSGCKVDYMQVLQCN